jgi:uncharacterized protein YhaN
MDKTVPDRVWVRPSFGKAAGWFAAPHWEGAVEYVPASEIARLAAELEAAKAGLASGSFYKEADIDRLMEDRDTLTSAGIVEIAARNPSVMEYMRHWEARAEKAEAELEAVKAERDNWRTLTSHEREKAISLASDLAALAEALAKIEALDPGAVQPRCSDKAAALRGARMGEIARDTLARLAP